MKTIKLLAGSMIAIAAVAAQPAFAQATDNLEVTANVTANCAVEAEPLGFGGVDVTLNQVFETAGNLNVTCTSGVEWAATAGLGGGAGATFASRKMTAGSDLMNYTLYTEPTLTTVWDDTTGVITGTGTGAEDPTEFHGRIFAGQTGLPVGAYADTVVITVNIL